MFAFQPELRYWFCDKFNGHFVGAHLHGGVYQAAAIDMPWGIWPELKDHRFKGHFYGLGVSYGYQWILGKHWNLEGNIGKVTRVSSMSSSNARRAVKKSRKDIRTM